MLWIRVLKDKQSKRNLILLILIIFLLISILPIAGKLAGNHYSITVNNYVPSLCYSTFFGGTDCDIANSLATANDGSFYLIGIAESDDFPILNAYDNSINGDYDTFISKFNENASLVWSTFFGGSNTDRGYDIVVANDNSIYLTGWTDSADFPTKNANDSSYNGAGDVFLARFASNGSLLWSTFFGGTHIDRAYALALAENGSCYIAGETYSTDLPMKNASDSSFNGGNNDAFIAKFSDNGSLLWSTFLGGNLWDRGYDIAVANNTDCFVTGYTTSTNFTTLDAYDDVLRGPNSGFIAKYTSDGVLNWSTYLGGNDTDSGRGIAVGKDNCCYITGNTYSDNFPTLNAYDSSYNNNGDAFVVKFSNSGSLLFGTYLGGFMFDAGEAITVSDDDNCYITGQTDSHDFPTENVDNNFLFGSIDAIVAKFSSSGPLLWSRYLGGSEAEWGHDIAVISNKTVFVTGYTYSTNFPTMKAYDSVMRGCSDAYITIYNGLDIPEPSTTPPTTPPTSTPPTIPTDNTSIAVVLFSPLIVLITTFTVLLIIRRKKKHN